MTKNNSAPKKKTGQNRTKPRAKPLITSSPKPTLADKCLLGYALALRNPWAAPPISLPLGGSSSRMAIKRYQSSLINMGGSGQPFGIAITSFEGETQFQTYSATGVVSSLRSIQHDKGRIVAAGLRCSYGGRSDDFGGICTRGNCNTDAMGDNIAASVDTISELYAYRVLRPNERCVSNHYFPLQDEDGTLYNNTATDSSCARIFLGPDFSGITYRCLIEFVVILDCNSSAEAQSYTTGNTCHIRQAPVYDLPSQTRAISRSYATGQKEIQHVNPSRHHQSFTSTFTHGLKEIADASKHVAEAVGSAIVTYGTYKQLEAFTARNATSLEIAGGVEAAQLLIEAA